MSDTTQNVFTRDDTFLGICQALGDDLGISPNWFRVALAPLLIWNPLAAILAYLAVGCVVGLVRIALPDRRRPAARSTSASTSSPAVDEMPLAEAA